MRDTLPEWALRPLVQALQALRGVQIVAMTLVAELQDFMRLASPRQLMENSWPTSAWTNADTSGTRSAALRTPGARRTLLVPHTAPGQPHQGQPPATVRPGACWWGLGETRASRKRFTEDLRMALGDTDKSLGCARRRPAPLLPLLERALGDMQCRCELGLGHASALPGFNYFIDCDLSDSGELSCLHLSHGLK